MSGVSERTGHIEGLQPVPVDDFTREFGQKAEIPSSTPNSPVRDISDADVMDINFYTHNVEFHGKTSSMAFLATIKTASVRKIYRQSQKTGDCEEQQERSLVSILHNTAFGEQIQNQLSDENVRSRSNNLYFRQSRLFIDGYFDNLHYSCPILDKTIFLTRWRIYGS